MRNIIFSFALISISAHCAEVHISDFNHLTARVEAYRQANDIPVEDLHLRDDGDGVFVYRADTIAVTELDLPTAADIEAMPDPVKEATESYATLLASAGIDPEAALPELEEAADALLDAATDWDEGRAALKFILHAFFRRYAIAERTAKRK